MTPTIGVYADDVELDDEVCTFHAGDPTYRRVLSIAGYRHLDQPMIHLAFHDGTEWAGSIHQLLYKPAEPPR